MSQDTIANLLSSLKNASVAGKWEVLAPFSKFSLELVKILVSEGYLLSAEKVLNNGRAQIAIKLNNPREKSKMIRNIKRISKSGARIYSSAEELASHNRRLGVVIISTPKGLITARQAAKKNLGGELICRVW